MLAVGLPDGDFVLVDFGASGTLTEERGGSEELVGTLAYMAPEQIRGEHVDGRADLYSLGCVVYAASVGMIRHALDLERPGALVIDFGELDSEWWKRRAAGSTRLKAGLYRAEAAKVRELEQAAARRASTGSSRAAATAWGRSRK